MGRDTLIDLFQEREHSDRPFLVYDDGYRSWTFTSKETAERAHACAAALRAAGLRHGSKVLIWGENRPGWIIALWGCLLEGIIAVPIDFRSSAAFVEKIRALVEAPLVIVGAEVELQATQASFVVWHLHDLEQAGSPSQPLDALLAPAIARTDTAEILFTSGATAEPKGVLITHKNLLANLVPVETEVIAYRKHWAVRFLAEPLLFPIRFLNLLPLSHLFGQTMAAFIPQMVDGVVVFLKGHNPAEITRQIRRRRISVLVCVPKMMEILREHVEHNFPEAKDPLPPGGSLGKLGFLRNWRVYRRVHRAFGWKFWAFIVGAAPLDPELEAFWRKLGYVVIQGYGLTETAPIVSLNHPFKLSHGTVGKPIGGVEMKLADDGEILVKGENITQGYYGVEGGVISTDGWFHTGDVGEMMPDGALKIRGRKKEMIVTPEGLNIFPEDVERILNELEGVKDSAVIEKDHRTHAVLSLDGSADPVPILRAANERLEDYQRIRSHSVWPVGETLPRTEGTRKLKRAAIREWVLTGSAPEAGRSRGGAGSLESVLARYAGGRPVNPETSLEELGLSSLERVQLLMELEETLGRPMDEGVFTQARTVEQLRALESQPAAPEEVIEFPRWSRSWWARAWRRINLPLWILPLARIFLWVKAEGRENLASMRGPVIFASNHQSYFDTPAIFLGLPGCWRYRIAPAMRKEFFDAHFHPEKYGLAKRFRNSLAYILACLGLNTFPLPQREAGTKQALQYAGELVSSGYSILIFPEGVHSEGDNVGKFQGGVGMIASRLGVPVVPVRVRGVNRVLHPRAKMATPGKVTVCFGKPIVIPEGASFTEIAGAIEAAVKSL